MSVRPWYVDVGIKFGVPTVAAGFLIWFNTFRLDAKVDAGLELQRSHQAQMSQDLASVVRLLELQNEQQRQMLSQQSVQINVLSRTCMNTSKTDADRIACSSLIYRQQ